MERDNELPTITVRSENERELTELKYDKYKPMYLAEWGKKVVTCYQHALRFDLVTDELVPLADITRRGVKDGATCKPYFRRPDQGYCRYHLYMHKIPKTGLRGLVENWQSDLIAALSVALVALPLSLGVAFASGVPPVAGLLTAIIGGVVTTFFRGSHLAINGPAAGLIAVVLSSMLLWEGDPGAFGYVLAATTIAGGIQVVLGILRLGRFAEIFHSTVIHGILAAIGVIIFAKQIHVALGTTMDAKMGIIDMIVDAGRQLPELNPFVAVISLAGLLLLIFQKRISYDLFHLIPAPMWVLVLSIPFVYAFNFFDARTAEFLGLGTFEVGPDLLVKIPANLLDAIIHPDFSQVGTWKFWSAVIAITLIASIQSLAMGKAVDKLDPYKRKTNLNKDLIGIGMATMVSGALGGLPIITVIVRSTVNVHNHAKTKWSNTYTGLLLLAFALVLSPVITKVPLAALAVLLVFTGYKLASPQVFRYVFDQGIEQLVFFVGTLLLTLYFNLLIGIFGGLALALAVHYLLAKMSVVEFYQATFNAGSLLIHEPDGSYLLRIKGIANFMGAIRMNRLLDEIPAGVDVAIDFSDTRLLDFTIQEKIDDFERLHAGTGGKVVITGLDKHISSTNHKHGLKLLTHAPYKLTKRERGVREIAKLVGWSYDPEPAGHDDFFEPFYFFQSRPIEYTTNCLATEDGDFQLEIADVTFEEGAYLAYDEYKTTLGLIRLPFTIPMFIIEQNDFLDRYLGFTGHKDIDYDSYDDVDGNYIIRTESTEAMKAFLTDDIRALLQRSDIPHIESCGESILIFPEYFQQAQIHEYSQMIKFMEELSGLIRRGQLESVEG